MLFAVGSLFALLARRLLVARAPDPFGPSAWAAAGYALFFWATVTWAVVVAPDWMLVYAAPADRLPMGLVHALFGVVCVLAALSGHTLAALAIQRGRRARAYGVLGVGLLLWLSLWALSFDRYSVVGTFSDWLAGRAVPVEQSPLAGPMRAMGVLSLVGFLVPFVLLVRANRRLRPA